MRMLRWMCGVMKKGQIRNEHVRGSVTKKITEKRLKVPGKRRRGRQKIRWKDSCKRWKGWDKGGRSDKVEAGSYSS